MKSTESSFSLPIVTLTALLVAACGGGGGDDNDGVTVPTAGISITATNAESITAQVVNSVDTVQGVAVGTDFLTAASTSVSDSSFNYSDLILEHLERIPALASQSSTVSVTGIVVTGTVDCLDGGTLTISADVSDPEVRSVGDTITATYNNCDQFDVVLNGTIRITITEVSASFDGTAPYILGIETILTSFSLTYGSLVITTDGDMTMLLSEDLAGNARLVLSGNSLTSSALGVVESLTNYLYDIEINDLSGDYSIDLQGTIASTAIGGSVSFVTLTTLTGSETVADGNPTAGVLLITTNIDDSRARVTAQPDGINVQIEVDTDGDGTYEITIMTTWTALGSP